MPFPTTRDYELSADDFHIIDQALTAWHRTADGRTALERARADSLQLRFANAHTAWIEPGDEA